MQGWSTDPSGGLATDPSGGIDCYPALAMRRPPLLTTLLLVAGCATAPPGKPGPGAGPGQVDPTQDPPASGVLGPVAKECALEIRVMDVGQGDGILIKGPDGVIAVMDAGHGSGGLKIADELRRMGKSRIDYAILSHAHLDHLGGFLRLMKKVQIGQVVDPAFPHVGKTYNRFLKMVEDAGVPYTVARRGMEIPLGAGAKLVLLAPEEPLFRGTRSDPNANTIVARLDYGEICMVLTGDAELPTEDRVLDSKQHIRCPLLKVAHHGSAHSTSERWLQGVRPEVAVISAGRRNKYGHPAQETLSRLQAVGARVYRTDQHGTVSLRTDGRRVMVVTSNAPGLVPAAAAPVVPQAVAR